MGGGEDDIGLGVALQYLFNMVDTRMIAQVEGRGKRLPVLMYIHYLNWQMNKNSNYNSSTYCTCTCKADITCIIDGLCCMYITYSIKKISYFILVHH